MAILLEKEFDFYLAHQDEFVKKYGNKHIVIIDEQVLGAYDLEIQAIEETVKTHDLGTFLVQFCTPGKDTYSANLHSRVVFA